MENLWKIYDICKKRIIIHLVPNLSLSLSLTHPQIVNTLVAILSRKWIKRKEMKKRKEIPEEKQSKGGKIKIEMKRKFQLQMRINKLTERNCFCLREK